MQEIFLLLSDICDMIKKFKPAGTCFKSLSTFFTCFLIHNFTKKTVYEYCITDRACFADTMFYRVENDNIS